MPSTPRPPRVAAAVALLAALGFGCTTGAGPVDGGPADEGESTDAQCGNERDDDSDGLIDCEDPGCTSRVACGRGDGGPRPDAAVAPCVGTPYDAVEAFAPVDIVWVVDTSGSMRDEAERVQENMQSFATAIGSVGLDWHVVMISTQAFVNVPEPLASDERYLLIDRDVFSDEPLRALLDELPRYRDFLRRAATTHFVAVTDDDSSLGWMEFDNRMLSALGRGYIFHTISSEVVGEPSFMYPDGQPCATDPGAFPPEGAAAPGVEYWELARHTGGSAYSICTPASEWGALFEDLTEEVAVPIAIPCEYDVPEPPAHSTLDFAKVNVRYTPSGGDPVLFRYAGEGGTPDCTNGGWYYDDEEEPSRIILCPSTCGVVSGDDTGRVEVELGCETVLI